MLVCTLKGSSFSDKSIKIQTASKETEQRHYSWKVQASAFILNHSWQLSGSSRIDVETVHWIIKQQTKITILLWPW